MSESDKDFFEELKRCYLREKCDFSWDWDYLNNKGEVDEVFVDEVLFYLAFNLSKNILHGPLPDHLHNRMAFNTNEWSKAYFEYLGT